MTTPAKDLVPADLGDNAEAPKDAAQAIEQIYKFANAECSKAIAWYYTKKRKKSRLGTFMRLSALVCVAIAGVIPVLGEILEYKDGKPMISPAWATIALAVAALLVGFDKFGGHTSGWVRYIRTGTALGNLQRNFHVDWAELQFIPLPEGENLNKAKIQLCRNFLTKLNELVGGETDQWAREFQSAIGEMEKVSNESPKTGA